MPTLVEPHLLVGERTSRSHAAPRIDLGSRTHGANPGPRVFAAAGLLAIAIVHLVVIVGHGEPSGLDYGNWLTLGHHWLGDGAPGGSESTYPPLVPVLVVSVVHMLGPTWGEGVLSSLGALVPALGVGAVLRGQASAWVTAVMVVLIAAGGATGEAAAWGGLPQLLSLGTGLWALWQLVLLLRTPTVRRSYQLGAGLLLTALISHLLLAQVAVCAVLVVVLHLLVVRTGLTLRGPWRGPIGIPRLSLRAFGALLVLAPLYLRLSQTVGASVVARSDSSTHLLLVSIGSVFRDAPWFWLPGVVLTAFVPVMLLGRRKEPLWLLVTSLTIAEVVVTLQTGEPRMAYLVPLDVACALGLWSRVLADSALGRPALLRWLGRAALLGLTCVVAVSGLVEFPKQREYYGNQLIAPGSVAAIDWLRDHTPRNALVAVAPVHGLPFGWWVEGLGRRATLTASSEAFLNFPDERRRAVEAVSLFSLGTDQVTLLLQQCQSLGVEYLFVPAYWGGMSTSAVGELAASDPSSVVYTGTGAVIVQVDS